MAFESLSDEELESELEARAKLRDCYFSIEQLEGGRWFAAFKQDDQTALGGAVLRLTAETTDRRRALTGLLLNDDLERQQGR